MGEITEALRRARHERARQEQSPGEVDAAEATAAAPRRAELPPAEQPASTGRAPRPMPARSGETTVGISRAKAGEWVPRTVLLAHPLADCFRQFAIRVRAAVEASSNPTVMVTSALRLEGKTTVSCNLALALASMAGERRVALVDLDLHRPGVARALGILPGVGLERVLDGESPLASARIQTDIPALDVFAIARPRPHAHGVLSGRRLREVVAELAGGYDAVVIDTPPVLLLPDVSLIAPHVGGCIAVVRAGNTPRSAFREMLEGLPADRLIGCFLNGASLPRHARYGYYYGDPDPPAAEDPAAG